MPTIIELPHVGESVTEGIISKWLKRPGERVRKYEPLLEVMTDKVTMEVPSPFTGVLTRTLVAEGATVPMGAPICEMEVEGGAPARASLPVPSAAPATAAARTPANAARRARVGEFMDSVRSVGPTGSGEGGQGLAATPVPPGAMPRASAPSTTGPANAAREAPPGGDTWLSPIVRRLIEQHAVDASKVRGTGTGGRITREDIMRYVDERTWTASAAPVTAADQQVPLSPLRKTIAERMSRSAGEIPAAWTMMEADVTGMVRCRNANRTAFERAHGVPLTYLAFAAKAVAESLREHPYLNARWAGDRIVLNGRVNLGVAVATDDGLVVPVVHDADRLGVPGISRRISAVVEAARQRSLGLPDVQGGTFTINNTGALGSIASVPIVNYPQAAILATEAIVKRPVVVPVPAMTGGEHDAIAVRSMMNLCLSFDHRVCDGAHATAFLRAVKQRLEAISESTPVE